MVDLWSCARRKCDFVEQIYANLFILELRSTDGVDLWSCTRRKCDFVDQIYAIRTFGTEIHRYGRFVELYKKANAALIVGPGGFCCEFVVRDFVAALKKKKRRRRKRRGLQQRVDYGFPYSIIFMEVKKISGNLFS
jgi:hypothetical protein